MPTVLPPVVPDEDIVIDEIGIETGLYGPYRLKSLYRPIFGVAGDRLDPVAVEGLVCPQIDYRPVAMDAFLADVARADRFRVDTLCRALHLRNHRNIGIDGLRLLFNCDADAQCRREAAVAQLRFMRRRLAAVDLEPGALLCAFRDGDVSENGVPGALAAEMHRLGMGVVIDGFGSGRTDLAWLRALRPAIVRIDGPWFRRVVQAEAAASLLAKLVAGLQGEGARVLIAEVETEAHLEAALEAGADLVQGGLLGAPAVVGSIADLPVLHVRDFFRRTEDVVVPMRPVTAL